MTHLLPATADSTAPTVVGWKYPTQNWQGSPADPVDIELTAFDERGDMKEVRFYANGTLFQTVPVYPFQARYTAPASAVGQTVQITAQAEDVAGNVATSNVLSINVVSSPTNGTFVQPPEPVNNPTITGTPTVGSTLTCVNGGFRNNPTTTSVAWLRDGVVITGAATGTYVVQTADIGRDITCRFSAENAANTGDPATATSARVTGSAAGTQGPAGPAGPTGPTGPAGPTRCHGRHGRRRAPRVPPAPPARPVPRARPAPPARRVTRARRATRPTSA